MSCFVCGDFGTMLLAGNHDFDMEMERRVGGVWPSFRVCKLSIHIWLAKRRRSRIEVLCVRLTGFFFVLLGSLQLDVQLGHQSVHEPGPREWPIPVIFERSRVRHFALEPIA